MRVDRGLVVDVLVQVGLMASWPLREESSGEPHLS
jgi:hypothetical protein